MASGNAKRAGVVSSYGESGVNLTAGAESVSLIRSHVESTWDQHVLRQYGGFAGLYRLAGAGVLALTVDGVGTKVKVAAKAGSFISVGKDIVNHCTDDLLAQWARPLLFADYFASSVLDPESLRQAVEGMAEACRAVKCCLVAGETAEMPGVYCEGEVDLVGCMLGVARQEDLDRPSVAPGDVLVGLKSSGLHTNGYSLARHLLFEKAGLGIDSTVPELDCTVGEALLKVHREYLTVLDPFISDRRVHGFAHITGGGLYDNVVRILPEGCRAYIEKAAWTRPPIFELLVSLGDLPDEEAYRVFNMGVGAVVAMERSAVEEFVESVSVSCRAIVVGDLREGERGVVLS